MCQGTDNLEEENNEFLEQTLNHTRFSKPQTETTMILET